MLPANGGEDLEAGAAAVISQAITLLQSFAGGGHIDHLIVKKNTFWQANTFSHDCNLPFCHKYETFFDNLIL